MASEQQLALLQRIRRLASALMQYDSREHRDDLAEALAEYHHKYEVHAQDAWRMEGRFR